MRFAVAILFVSTLVGAQIPNPGFESWTNYALYEAPDLWGNTNDFTKTTGFFTCTKGLPGQTGSYYTSLSSLYVPGKGLVPGILVSGNLDTVSFKPVSGFPFTNRPQSLDCYVQFMPNSQNDTGFISVLLTKWDVAGNKRDTVAVGKTDLLGMAHSWILYSTGLNYMKGDNPDTAVITLSASGSAPEAGSYLYVDDLSFYGNVIGTPQMETSRFQIITYPNPFSSQVCINSWNQKPVNALITIYDILGRVVYNELCLKMPLEIKTELWHDGIYTVKILTDQYSIQKKITKQ